MGMLMVKSDGLEEDGEEGKLCEKEMMMRESLQRRASTYVHALNRYLISVSGAQEKRCSSLPLSKFHTMAIPPRHTETH